MSNPAITVVMPTHNRSRLLERAVASVQAQSYQDWELVIVDDGSTDETPSMLAGLSDARIRFLRNEQALGAAGARNAGIRSAAAPLVAFLDDDDEYHAYFLTAVVQAFGERPDAGFGWTGTRWVSDSAEGAEAPRDERWQPSFPSTDAAYRGFLRNRRVGTNCGLTVRREAFDLIGLFDESLESAEDTEFLIRAARAFPFVALGEPLVIVHDHDGPRLRTSPAKAYAYAEIVDRHRTTLASDASLWADVHYKTAWLHYHAGERRGGRRYLLSGLRRRPFHVKSLLGIVMFELFGARGPDLHLALSNRWRAARKKGTK